MSVSVRGDIKRTHTCVTLGAACQISIWSSLTGSLWFDMPHLYIVNRSRHVLHARHNQIDLICHTYTLWTDQDLFYTPGTIRSNGVEYFLQEIIFSCSTLNWTTHYSIPYFLNFFVSPPDMFYTPGAIRSNCVERFLQEVIFSCSTLYWATHYSVPFFLSFFVAPHPSSAHAHRAHLIHMLRQETQSNLTIDVKRVFIFLVTPVL